MANGLVVGTDGASGYFEINVCKPLVIFNTAQSTTMVTDGCVKFSIHPAGCRRWTHSGDALTGER
jgi:fumarate hydratase class II